MTYRIPVENVAQLNARLQKLVRRAVKLGMTPPTVTYGNPYNHQLANKKFVRVVDAEVTGGAIVVKGWTFVGSIDHIEGQAVFRAVPGEQIPAQYRNCAPTCDHCQTNRRRNSTFVLRHDDGRYARVGRNCLSDFLDETTPDAIASLAECIMAVNEALASEEDAIGGIGGSFLHATEDFLSAVACSIRHFGWVSRRDADA